MTFVERIENHLKAHVLAGEQPPYPLTLSGIAEHFGVSLMPAREAVDSLIEQRFLVQHENHRLAINPRRKAKRPSRVAKNEPEPIDPDRAVEDFVVNLSLQGQQAYLREEATAEQFGIGRTVVRSIFSRLAGSRMIEHVPRCGWRVNAYREQDLLDFLDVRETLELRALDLAKDHFDNERLQQLFAANTPDQRGRPRLDNNLHRYWIELANNRYLREFFAQNGVYFQALFDRAVLDDSIVAQRASEHRAILTALIKRQWARARQELSSHILGQREHVARLLAHQQQGTRQ